MDSVAPADGAGTAVMSATSAIEWTDRTWNPTVGCTRVSAGCEHCYAEQLAARLDAMGQANYTGLTRRHADGSVGWTGTVRMLPDRLREPVGWKRPQRVFVNSMSDLFHDEVPTEFIEDVFAVMAACPQHTFQLLTKRPERMLDAVWLLTEEHSERPWPLPNVWLGVSVEDQSAAEARIPVLMETPARVRFLSCEPLLGEIKLRWTPDWVIVGGESGPSHRLMNLVHLDDLAAQCLQASIPLFVKQDSGPRPGQQGRIPDWAWALKQFPGVVV